MTNSKQPIISRGGGLLDRALVMGPYRISLFPPLPSVQTVFGAEPVVRSDGSLIRVHYCPFAVPIECSGEHYLIDHQSLLTDHSLSSRSLCSVDWWFLTRGLGHQFPLSRFTMWMSITRALFSLKFTDQHIEDWSQQQPKERDADHARKRCDTHCVPHFGSSAVRCNQRPDPGNKGG